MESSFFDLRKEQFEKIDAVFLSPPWGGVDYNQDNNYDLVTHILYGIDNWIAQSLRLSHELILFLPRNIIINQFAKILASLKDK